MTKQLLLSILLFVCAFYLFFDMYYFNQKYGGSDLFFAKVVSSVTSFFAGEPAFDKPTMTSGGVVVTARVAHLYTYLFCVFLLVLAALFVGWSYVSKGPNRLHLPFVFSYFAVAIMMLYVAWDTGVLVELLYL